MNCPYMNCPYMNRPYSGGLGLETASGYPITLESATYLMLLTIISKICTVYLYIKQEEKWQYKPHTPKLVQAWPL